MEFVPVIMIREDLRGIPQCPMPDGYRMRSFRRGDRATWVRVEQASEPWGALDENTFDREFGNSLSVLARRQLFLVAPDGSDVGTITAWYTRRHLARPWGRIHWLAIMPEHRRRGLSKSMMTVAMNRLRALGHRRAMLATDTRRIVAIRTYLDFGFVPDMTTGDAERAWRLVREQLDHPALR